VHCGRGQPRPASAPWASVLRLEAAGQVTPGSSYCDELTLLASLAASSPGPARDTGPPDQRPGTVAVGLPDNVGSRGRHPYNRRSRMLGPRDDRARSSDDHAGGRSVPDRGRDRRCPPSGQAGASSRAKGRDALARRNRRSRRRVVPGVQAWRACSMLIAAEIQCSSTSSRRAWSSAECELMPH
jgi:hypothetical protein